MVATPTLKHGTNPLNGTYTELQYLRNILIFGDQDIESSADILAICTRIAQLEKELQYAESI